MKVLQIATLATCALLAARASLLAQSTVSPDALISLHHDESVPDYVAAIWARELATIRVPPPPVAPHTIAPFHHSHDAPNYWAAIQPPQPATVAIPPPPPGETPLVLLGLYLNAWVFGSSRLNGLLELADQTEINAFVIDVKDATGHITYRSNVPIAIGVGANAMVRAPDVRARLARLRAHGIHSIARIVVARDPLLAKRKPEWAIRDIAGGLWRDGLGDPWVDAYQDSVWIYAAELAAEAVVIGFEEIQFDYVRWPDEPRHRMLRAVYPAKRPGDSPRAAARRHLNMLKQRIGKLGVPFTVDVFGLTTSAHGGMGIGQYWDDLVRVADVVLPMVYPSHYPRGAYGLPYPNSEPYTVVRRALEDGIRRNAGVEGAAKIRPYLQAFTLRRPRYTATEVRAQISAVEDLGLTDWILWNARGVYPADALRPGGRVGKPTAPGIDKNFR